jgi:hypothetical protein
VELARAKAQNLINDDALSDLYEILEMYIGAILEHFKELENRSRLCSSSFYVMFRLFSPYRAPPTPVVAEAASSLIFAAPQTELKGLRVFYLNAN